MNIRDVVCKKVWEEAGSFNFSINSCKFPTDEIISAQYFDFVCSGEIKRLVINFVKMQDFVLSNISDSKSLSAG